MVERSDQAQQCAGPAQGDFPERRPGGHCARPQALGGTEQSAQIESVPIGAVDADLLHQARVQAFERPAAEGVADGEGPAARTLREVIGRRVESDLTRAGQAEAACGMTVLLTPIVRTLRAGKSPQW